MHFNLFAFIPTFLYLITLENFTETNKCYEMTSDSNVEENDIVTNDNTQLLPPRKYVIVWTAVPYYIYLHLAALYGLYLGVMRALWPTIVFTFFIHITTGVGLTAGVHRLWAHKSYKAKLPLQILLMLLHSATNTHTVITWCRNHWLHHKYSDTDADPHNSRRGFFFCHIGWLMVRKHPEAVAKGKAIDLTELYANPVLRFQQKYALPLIISSTFIIPSVTPLLWSETFTTAYHLNLLRVFLSLSIALIINSVAHKYGTKPYDKRILPTDNKLAAILTFGEGFHNYHHVFPQDYRASELGDVYLNVTTRFIDFCVWLGQAYDVKYTSPEVVRARMERTGERIKDA